MIETKMSRRLALATLSAGAAALLAAGPAAAQGGPPIKVGAPLAVTGPASFLGDPAAKTLRLLVDQINGSGGVIGRRLELVLYDTGGDARQAVTFTRRLIEDDKVDFIIGPSTTGETMPAIPLVEEAGVPMISLAGANVVVDPVRKWVFKTPHSDTMAVQKIYEDMKKNSLQRVAILGGSGGFDQSCRAEARKLAATMGVSVVADETYAPTDTDMTPQLTKIKNTAGVQAILGCGFGAVTSITARNWKQLAMTDIPFYFNHGVGSQQFIDGAQGAAEGIKLPVAAVLVADQLPASDPQVAVSRAYVQAYRAAYNQPVASFGGHAYSALTMTVEAIKRAGSTDKAKVRDEIEKTRGFAAPDGIFTMSPTDHNGLALESFKMVEVRNNGWKLLY